MHYYKRHLGDYARDTGHLTALEHGIYTLLLDWYYANERPIPPDKTVRIARGNPEETETVLSEFFRLTDDGWVHHYADRVIAEYNAKAERNREAGKLGGRPKKTQTVSKENPPETLTTNHEPLTTRESKALVPPAAARQAGVSHFDRFWAVYPNKKGKKDAERHWRREGCDDVADSLIAHVRMMMAQDDGWRRGYAPMGSTYLNGRRWEDIPLGPPKDRLSKSVQALIALEGMKNGMDGSGSQNGFPEIDLPRIGSTARVGTFGRNGDGVG